MATEATVVLQPNLCFQSLRCFCWALKGCGGEGGIRTPDRLAPMSDFESGAFNRALPPLRAVNHFITDTYIARVDLKFDSISTSSVRLWDPRLVLGRRLMLRCKVVGARCLLDGSMTEISAIVRRSTSVTTVYWQGYAYCNGMWGESCLHIQPATHPVRGKALYCSMYKSCCLSGAGCWC